MLASHRQNALSVTLYLCIVYLLSLAVFITPSLFWYDYIVIIS